jgi:ribosomal protein S27AE
MQRGGFVTRTRCPRCGGSVYLDSDHYGWFEQCLQCGFTRNMKKVTRVQVETGDKHLAAAEEEPSKIK